MISISQCLPVLIPEINTAADLEAQDTRETVIDELVPSVDITLNPLVGHSPTRALCEVKI
jgi:hypothetical protein